MISVDDNTMLQCQMIGCFAVVYINDTLDSSPQTMSQLLGGDKVIAKAGNPGTFRVLKSAVACLRLAVPLLQEKKLRPGVGVIPSR